MNIIAQEFLSTEEFELLDELLERYVVKGNANAAISDCSELDGFLTAIHLSPTPVMPSFWLPVLFNQESPSFDADIEQLQEFMNLIFRHYNFISRILRLGKKFYQPLLAEVRIERRKLLLLSPWCKGFMLGAKLVKINRQAKIKPFLEIIRQNTKIPKGDVPLMVEQRKTVKQIQNAVLSMFTTLVPVFDEQSKK
ncbi:UPF0149 family protein [Lonepinella koalarum]|uniref:UPF0149 family protein n=1 Tax=Lonepinella koalarum TaxID=53417 RepID=UPI003F6DC149